LIEAARRDGHFVVVSIFVNPTQFGPNEDYLSYPRDEGHDSAECEAAGAELVFLPPVEEMYPSGAATTVHVAKLTDTLCGSRRPGHFDGVATICSKLFNIVQPDAAYFGQKDAQQLAVLRRMVRDLDMPVKLVGCPIVREPNGLALSSRNDYLSDTERAQAACLHKSLLLARDRIRAGEGSPARIVADMRDLIEDAGPARIDYIEFVDPETMQPVERVDGPVLVALAVYIGPARLIDNMTMGADA